VCGVAFVNNFWDCSCGKIHRKSKTKRCKKCRDKHGESPDSRLHEVLAFYPRLMTAREREISIWYLMNKTPEQLGFYGEGLLTLGVEDGEVIIREEKTNG
jgi:hypothetical protein